MRRPPARVLFSFLALAPFGASLVTGTVLAAAASSATFEAPEYVAGAVNGQQGWFALGNAPSAGTVVANPAGGSMLAITNLPVYSGVTNGLNSPVVDGAGESGPLNGGLDAEGRNQLTATLSYHTPAVPVTGGTFIELNPSFRNPGAETASRYARAAITTSIAAQPVLYSSYPGPSGTFPTAGEVALAWDTTYLLDYDLRLYDGLDGGGPNDTFCITVRDSAGAELGTIASYSWEAGYTSGGYGGGPGARLVNGLDVLARSTLNSPDRGAIDDVAVQTATVATGVAAPANVTATAVDDDVTVGFERPNADNCTGIESFTVTNDQTGDVVVLADGEASATFADLDAGTYVFSVAVSYTDGATANADAAPVEVAGALPAPTTTDPATTVPTTTAPATTVPATAVPATTVPATTVPATTVPVSTLASNTTSASTPVAGAGTGTPARLAASGTGAAAMLWIAAALVLAGVGAVAATAWRKPVTFR